MSDKSSFSERMRVHADRTWNAILGHRFFREVATDAIDDRVFARYLRIEYGFVDTAARALGGALASVFMGSSPIRSRCSSTRSNGWVRPPMSGRLYRLRGSLFRCPRSF